MSIPGSINPLFLGAAGQSVESGYEIERSLRFNSADSAYLSRTPSVSGDRKTWTWAGWVKRSALSAKRQELFRCNTAPLTQFGFAESAQGNAEALIIYSDGGAYLLTTPVFRDVSAWYHITVVFDTTNGTAGDRVRVYVNGSRITTFNTATYPSPSFDTSVNTTNLHYVGASGNANEYLDGYLADIHFIDGQALTPSSFGEPDDNGVWQPKAYTGTYPGNSFHLDFADNSAATATTLGKDTSGNGNNWTPNNFYVSNTVYSSGVSITGSYANNTNARMAFDGSISTKLEMSGTNNQITFTPPAAISFSSTVEVYLTPTGDVTYTRYSFNGGADTSFAAGDGWKTVASGGGTFTSLVLKQGAQSNNIGFAAIRINGSTILVDASSAGNDSLVDSPTSYGTDTGAGGEVRGNYCTLNPLYKTGAGTPTYSNGNLDFSAGGSGDSYFAGTFAISGGKYYYEATLTAIGNGFMAGICAVSDAALTANIGSYRDDGTIYNLTSTTQTSGSSYTSNDVIGVAIDGDAGTVKFYKNGAAQGSTPSFSYTAGTVVIVRGRSNSTGAAASFNFGQRPFAYTAPSGFKALCTANLPEPTIADGSTAMDVKLYTGNGSTQTISGLGFSPDLVWTKGRSYAYSNNVFDTVRTATKRLTTDATNAEDTLSGVTAFNSDGFTLGSATGLNDNGSTYVAWAWDAGSSTVTNPDGSITSQVRANASAGFSIVTWTATSNVETIGHGLGVAPEFIVVKDRSAAGAWYCYHKSLGNAARIQLNETSAATTGSSQWNSTSPTSLVYTIGSGAWQPSGNLFVSYCFAPVAGYSAIGSYLGNSSADGPFVYTGFRPRFIMVKNAGATTDWVIVDTARETFNVVDDFLRPNLSAAEGTRANLAIDILSNGFKHRGLDNYLNGTNTHVYIAFAENPFQYARAR